MEPETVKIQAQTLKMKQQIITLNLLHEKFV